MIGPFSWIDLLFLVTIVLLVFNGFRNGAVFSLVNLLSIPIAFAVAVFFGPQFTLFLASNGLPATPLISYLVLFFGSVLVLHIVGTVIRGIVHDIPIVNFGDTLLGGLIGFVEAWLLWVIVLLVLGSFLQNAQSTIHAGNQLVPGLNIQVSQFQTWHDIYNQAVSHSLFAQVNSFIIRQLPALPKV
jgi:uncharacterized membrane protein required for colicin V production